MRILTNVSKLHHQKDEKNQVILSKFGPGRVFGEVVFVVNKFEGYQPYTIKCVSVKGELLRISAHEFQKKFMSNKKVL